MRTRAARPRSTTVVREGNQRATYLAVRLGRGLKEQRERAGLTQQALGNLVGLSQPAIYRLEAGRGASAGIDTWAICARALGLQLAAFLEAAAGAEQPRDLVHLRNQQLVGRHAEPGGWNPLPEALVTAEGGRPRFVDVSLTRPARREIAVTEVWDLLDDIGNAMRGLQDKVERVRSQMGSDWHVEGLLVVRATRRNRQLVREFATLFAARYPASSQGWLLALANPDTAMPGAAGLVWASVKGDRLFAARLG